MAISVPSVVAGGPIEADWGNTVDLAITELQTDKIDKSGGTFTGRVHGLGEAPISDHELVSRLFVTDFALNQNGDTMTGPLILPAAQSGNVNSATNKAYVDQRDHDWYAAYTVPLTATVNTKVNRSGDTMTGHLAVNGNPYAGQQGSIVHTSGTLAANIHDGTQCNLHLMHSGVGSSGGAFADGVWYIAFCGQTGGYINGYIKQVGSTGVQLVSGSDYRLKDDLGPIEDPVGNLMALQPKHLRWKVDGREFDGFIAHELDAVVPQAVDGVKNATNPDGSVKSQMVDISQVVPLLTAALQEAHTKIVDLTTRLEALEAV